MLAAFVASTACVAHAQSPYAGLQARSIKALSDQQVADLQAGRGLGMASRPSSTDIRVLSMCWS
jgi:hypothetical protein